MKGMSVHFRVVLTTFGLVPSSCQIHSQKQYVASISFLDRQQGDEGLSLSIQMSRVMHDGTRTNRLPFLSLVVTPSQDAFADATIWIKMVILVDVPMDIVGTIC